VDHQAVAAPGVGEPDDARAVRLEQAQRVHHRGGQELLGRQLLQRPADLLGVDGDGRAAAQLEDGGALPPRHQHRRALGLPAVRRHHRQRRVAGDPERHHALLDDLGAVEHLGVDALVLVPGAAAGHRHPRTAHLVDALGQALQVGLELVGDEQHRAVGAVAGLRPAAAGHVLAHLLELRADAGGRGGAEAVRAGGHGQHGHALAQADVLAPDQLPRGGGADEQRAAGDRADAGEQGLRVELRGGEHQDDRRLLAPELPHRRRRGLAAGVGRVLVPAGSGANPELRRHVALAGGRSRPRVGPDPGDRFRSGWTGPWPRGDVTATPCGHPDSPCARRGSA